MSIYKAIYPHKLFLNLGQQYILIMQDAGFQGDYEWNCHGNEQWSTHSYLYLSVFLHAVFHPTYSQSIFLVCGEKRWIFHLIPSLRAENIQFLSLTFFTRTHSVRISAENFQSKLLFGSEHIQLSSSGSCHIFVTVSSHFYHTFITSCIMSSMSISSSSDVKHSKCDRVELWPINNKTATTVQCY